MSTISLFIDWANVVGRGIEWKEKVDGGVKLKIDVIEKIFKKILNKIRSMDSNITGVDFYIFCNYKGRGSFETSSSNPEPQNIINNSEFLKKVKEVFGVVKYCVWIWPGAINTANKVEVETLFKSKDPNCMGVPNHEPSHSCISPDDLLLLSWCARSTARGDVNYIISDDQWRSEYALFNCSESQTSLMEIIKNCSEDGRWEMIPRYFTGNEWSDDVGPINDKMDYIGTLNGIITGKKQIKPVLKEGSTDINDLEFDDKTFNMRDYPGLTRKCEESDKLGPLLFLSKGQDGVLINPETCNKFLVSPGQGQQRAAAPPSEVPPNQKAVFFDFDGVAFTRISTNQDVIDALDPTKYEIYNVRPSVGDPVRTATPKSLLDLIKDIESDGVKLYFVSDGGNSLACRELLKKALGITDDQEIINKFQGRLYFDLGEPPEGGDILKYDKDISIPGDPEDGKPPEKKKQRQIQKILTKLDIKPVNAVFIDDTLVNISAAKSYIPGINVVPVKKKLEGDQDQTIISDEDVKKIRQFLKSPPRRLPAVDVEEFRQLERQMRKGGGKKKKTKRKNKKKRINKTRKNKYKRKNKKTKKFKKKRSFNYSSN